MEWDPALTEAFADRLKDCDSIPVFRELRAIVDGLLLLGLEECTSRGLAARGPGAGPESPLCTCRSNRMGGRATPALPPPMSRLLKAGPRGANPEPPGCQEGTPPMWAGAPPRKPPRKPPMLPLRKPPPPRNPP